MTTPPAPKEVARFRREAEIASSLDHPNIVPIYDWGEVDGCFYLAMKWLTGPGLDHAESLTPRQIAAIGADIAMALHAAHLSGVLHRDVKPANIILSDHHPYLVDFGLSRGVADQTLTKAGTRPGTLAYMPPELFANPDSPHDRRCDIYSLGATLYELLAQRPLFATSDPERLIHAIIDARPAPLALGSSDQDLEIIVRRALRKEPHRRFASALEMAEELRRYLGGTPILSKATSRFERMLRLARRHKRTALALGGTVSVTIAIGAILLFQTLEQLRRRATELATARAAITAEQLDQSTQLSRAFSERWGPSDPASIELRQRSEQLRLLELLTDTALDQADDQLPEDLAALLDQVEAADLTDRYPRKARLAAAVLQLRLVDIAAARQSLEQLTAAQVETRAVAALRLCLGSSRADDALPPAADSLDRLLAAAILSTSAAHTRAAEDELRSAAESMKTNYRTLQARAMLLFRRRKFDQARVAFDFLELANRPSASTTYYRAYLRNISGEYDQALELAKLLPDTSRSALLRVEVALRQGDSAAATELLRATLASHDGPSPRLYAAQLALGSGDLERAHEHYEAVLTSRALQYQAERARAGLLEIEYDRCLDRLDRFGNSQAKFDALEAEAQTFFDAARYSHPRAIALHIKAWCQFYRVGRHSDASLSSLRLAVEADPELPATRIALAEALLVLSVTDENDDAGRLQRECLTQTRTVLQSPGKVRFVVSDDDRVQAIVLGLQAARRLGDRFEARRYIDASDQLSMAPEDQAVVDSAKRWLRQ